MNIASLRPGPGVVAAIPACRLARPDVTIIGQPLAMQNARYGVRTVPTAVIFDQPRHDEASCVFDVQSGVAPPDWRSAKHRAYDHQIEVAAETALHDVGLIQ